MVFRELLKKKEKLETEADSVEALPTPPQFTFLRSTTNTQEEITIPDDPPNYSYDQPASADDASDGGHHTRFSRLTGRSRSQSSASNASRSSEASKSTERLPSSKRLSQRLGLRKQDSSAVVPGDLPEIQDGQDGDGDGDAWEERATILARENEKVRSRPATPVNADMPDVGGMKLGEAKEGGIVASKSTDDNIQEAIRLHEAGELKEATKMFGRLADPNGENNALSQVLYALALRCVRGSSSFVLYYAPQVTLGVTKAYYQDILFFGGPFASPTAQKLTLFSQAWLGLYC
jgi:hypothetical protein